MSNGMLHQEEYDRLPLTVQDFIRYMDVVKNKSTLTTSEYASDLRTFFRFMKVTRGTVPADLPFDQIDLTDIDEAFLKTIRLQDAYAFLSYCKNVRDNSAATRARKVSSIRAYFKYLTLQAHILEENPMQELDTPKKKKSLPKYLTLEESLQLLQAVDGKFKERDYCMLTLLLNCGVRLSELVGLNCSDVRADRTMRVTGKGDKERTIYLNDACVSAIQRYLAVRPVDGVRDKDALFLSSRLQRISPKTVQHIVYEYLEKCGLSHHGYSVHKLRHTAATLMYQHGNVDVLVLKEILGHENLGTTEIYTHIVDQQLQQAADSNPLSKIQPEKGK